MNMCAQLHILQMLYEAEQVKNWLNNNHSLAYKIKAISKETQKSTDPVSSYRLPLLRDKFFAKDRKWENLETSGTQKPTCTS